jgi:phosphate transport system substrate-binding protein
VAALAILPAACGDEETDDSGASPGGSILGAGASFPAPLYTKWGSDYNDETGVQLNYQSIGSGGGISAIKDKTVYFGASDAPLEQDELEADGLVQFPMVVGGVVPVINLEGIEDGELKLTPKTLAGIFMGEITKWDDAAIKADNADVDLPSSKISVVHRSDGSGTTWIFTNYLTAAAGDVWTEGADKEIAWPVGVGGKGNEGVAASVQQLSGSIGYVEYAYAKQTDMPTAQLQNKDGNWVKPSIDTFSAAAANADWEGSLPSMALVLVDQPGTDTWPITGASFILMHEEQTDEARAKMVLEFFDWCYTNGEPAATELDYVAIPPNVYAVVQDEVWTTIMAGGSPVWE